MKKNSENRFPAISAEETKELTSVVKESLAKPRVFSAAELWDIRRRSEMLMMRKRSIV